MPIIVESDLTHRLLQSDSRNIFHKSWLWIARNCVQLGRNNMQISLLVSHPTRFISSLINRSALTSTSLNMRRKAMKHGLIVYRLTCCILCNPRSAFWRAADWLVVHTFYAPQIRYMEQWKWEEHEPAGNTLIHNVLQYVLTSLKNQLERRLYFYVY